MASAQVGLFEAQPNQHRARHVRRTRGGAPECGLPSLRPEPRQKWSSQSPLNAEASPDEATALSQQLSSPTTICPTGTDAQARAPRTRKRAHVRSSPRAATQASNEPGDGRGRCLVNLEEPRFTPKWNKSKNTGITSVDRSTKATLSTYNPWIQLSRLQKIYHFQHQKLICIIHTLPFKLVHMQKGRDLMLVL